MADEPNDREEFQVDGVYIQDRDMDNNGIPDFQQSHANGSPENPYYGPGSSREDDGVRGGADPIGAGASFGSGSSRSGAGSSDEDVDPTIGRADFGPDAASDSPYSRAQREAAGHYVATVDVSKPGEKDRQSRAGTADSANPKVTDAELRSDSNTNRALDDERYRKALHDLEQRRLRNAPKRKSKIGEEIKRASAAYKTDDKDGLALGKAIMGGLKGGLKHAEQQAMERKAARDNQAADKIARDFVESEAAIRRNEIADEKIRAAAARDEKKAKEEVAGNPGPDAPGPGGSDPKGPGGDGPGNGGGPEGPGGGKPQETATPANDDVKPKEAEAPAPDVAKPANENDAPEPLRETGTGRAAERAQALHGETQPAARETAPRTSDDRTRAENGGRDPSDAARSGDVEVRTIQAKQPEAKQPEAKAAQKPAAGQSGQKVSSDVAPGDANASAGAGMIMAAVNPPLGIAATAAKSRHAQVEAGAEHEDIRKPKTERVMPKRHGPEAPSVSVDVPGRVAPRSGPRPVPERRLETTGADNVVEFRRPTRAGGIMAQAGSLPRSRRPDVASRGPETSQPRTRIMGVGTAMGRFIENDVRGAGGKGADRDDQSIAAAHRNRGNGR